MKNILKLFLSMAGIIFTLLPIWAYAAFPIATTTLREMSNGMAFDGTNYLVGIQVVGIEFSDVSAQLISQSGMLIGPRISTGRTGSVPRIAFDGTNYLMVWSDDANHPDNDIYGQLVGPSGTLIGSPIPISTAPGRQDGISVSFDGTNSLVVWEDERNGTSTDIYGQLISKSGNLVGSEIKINTSDVIYRGEVAFDGANYLIVWDAGNTIRGQLISGSGIHIGPEIFIANKLGSCPNEIDLISVLFDEFKYLVVWNDMSGNCTQDRDIYGQFISPSGSIVGTKITISTVSGQQWLPFLTFDGSRYLLTWTDMRNDTNNNGICDFGEGTCWDIYGQYIDKSGSLSGPEFIINNDASKQYISPVIYANGTYLVIWTSGDKIDGAYGDVYGQFIPKTRFEEFDPAINYTGLWNSYSCIACSGGALNYSKQTGAKAEFSFNGTGIKWIVAKGPKMGKAKVYLDNVNKGLIDLYSVTAKMKQVLQAIGLTPGNHTLTIVVSGLKNPSATDKIINIDAFEVVP